MVNSIVTDVHFRQQNVKFNDEFFISSPTFLMHNKF